MSIDLPQNLLESAKMPLPELLNFTPLHFAEKKKVSHGKLYVRILMFLLVVGIFTPSFIYFYRSSSARTLTSDREFMQDIVNTSRGRKLATTETTEKKALILPEKEPSFFETIMLKIKNIFPFFFTQ
jgi:hypothetical protein